MMTTSMLYGMKKTIERVRESAPDVKILVGGAAVSKEIADKLGADGYGVNAVEAVKEAVEITSK
jgi:methanogenic corrinoid protein MtbC1